MRGCFAENRHVVFFWNLPGEKACYVLMEWKLERAVLFGKDISIIQQTMNDIPSLVCLARICWSSWGFANPGLH